MFTKAHVGWDGAGRPLYEYRLDGTPLVVLRTYPDRPWLGGWTVYDDEAGEVVLHVHRFADAKEAAMSEAGR